jgi:hypothetical protein
VERIFGLNAKKKEHSHAALPSEDVTRTAGINRVKVVLNAIGNELFRNKGPPYAVRLLKITCGGEVVRRENPSAQSVDAPSHNGVYFSWRDCERSESLTRFFFCRPDGHFPCARCQVQGISLFNCRVRNGHSNPDFNLMLNFSGLGGVRGLLSPLTSQPIEQRSYVGFGVQGTLPFFLPQVNGTSGMANQCSANVGNSIAINGNVAIQPDPPRPILNDALADEDDKDPREALQKAQSAWEVANRLQAQAQVLVDTPAILSDTFIKTSFPFDRNDNHYMYCIICGLSGDLLCCDGCPNVVHPACVRLSEIPEGDWFCKACCKSTSSVTGKSAVSGLPSISDSSGMKDSESNLLMSPDDLTTKAENHCAANVSITTAPGDTQCQGASEVASVATQDKALATPQSIPAAGPLSQHKNDELNADGCVNIVQCQLAPDICSEDSFQMKVTELEELLEELETLTPKPKLQPTLHDKEQGVTEIRNPEEQPSKNDAPDTDVTCIQKEKDGGEEKEVKEVVTEVDVTSDDSGHTQIEKDQENFSFSESEGNAALPIPLGTVLMKSFGNQGEFRGKVVGVPDCDNPYYDVRYDDGDEEEMSESELLECMPLSESRKYRRHEKKRSGRKPQKENQTPHPKSPPNYKKGRGSKVAPTASTGTTTRKATTSESTIKNVATRRGRPPKTDKRREEARSLHASAEPRELFGKRPSCAPKRFAEEPISKYRKYSSVNAVKSNKSPQKKRLSDNIGQVPETGPEAGLQTVGASKFSSKGRGRPPKRLLDELSTAPGRKNGTKKRAKSMAH